MFLLGEGSLGNSWHEAVVVDISASTNGLIAIKDLEGFKSALRELKDWAKNQSFILNDDALPHCRSLGPVVRQGHLLLGAIAVALDATFPQGKFMEAVRLAWAEAEGKALDEIPEREKVSFLCSALLNYLGLASQSGYAPEHPDHKGYRLDSLVHYVSAALPELFGGLRDRGLGGLLRKYRLAKGMKRHRFYLGQGTDAPWEQRTCVVLNEERLKALASEGVK